MADLTDEDKAKLVLGDVESEADETTPEPETPIDEENDNQPVEEAQTDEEESEEDKPSEDEPEEAAEPTPPSLTKQFPNLKGDTWESYAKELEIAYQNSFSEALRLNNELKEKNAQVAQPAAQPDSPAVPDVAPVVNPTRAELDSLPEIQYAKAQMNRDMVTSFNDFSKDYPQALEADSFDKFQKASDGVSAAFRATEGRTPTWSELYKGIAGALGWQPANATAKKDAALKDAVSSSQTVSSTAPPAKRSKVSDAEAQVYMRMKNVSREQAVKDLSTVK
jgi:hypothetical protein